MNEAWHHFVRGIKTAFLSIVVPLPKITHPPPKNKVVYFVFGEILSVIYQQSLT